MPGLKPISRRELIIRLRLLGFVGPFPGKRHEYMERERFRLRIPNPHKGDIGVPLLAQILTEAGISREEWEAL
jgi:hypothetical protein